MMLILPAAGKAERLLGLPKFLLPTPDCSFLLRRHCYAAFAAGMDVAIGANPSNRLLIRRYAPDSGVRIYLGGESMVATVLRARRYCDAFTALALPDSYWSDHSLLPRLVEGLYEVDVAVGVFETRPEQRAQLGMVTMADDDALVQVVDKPAQTNLTWAWGVLAWRPTFWQHLRADAAHVGEALNAAVAAGLRVQCVRAAGAYHDCGTLAGYKAMLDMEWL